MLLLSFGSVNSAAATDGQQVSVERERYIVRFTGALESGLEIQSLGNAAAAFGSLKRIEDRAASEVFMQSAAATLSSVGAGSSIKLGLPRLNAVAVELTPGELTELAAKDYVAGIERDPPRYLMAEGDFSQSVPYGISLVQSDQLPYGPAPGIKVCVVDSGFDLGHPDLPSGSRVTGDAAPDVGNWFEDGTGHGTHVAGSIMALANQQGVIGATNGGDYGVHIYKVFPDETETVNSSDVVAGVQACADAGASVVNLSLGCSGDGCFSAFEELAFERFAQAGVLVVAAAGNDGRDPELATVPSYPAGYASVIAVAAVDEDSQNAAFSQRYPEVELAAPGVGVNSTVPRGRSFDAQLSVAEALFDNNVLTDSPIGDVSGPLVDCGIGDSVCTNSSGAICLIERGTTFFVDKARSCESGGGVGAVIFNNVPGPFFGLLGEDNGLTIPVTGVSDTVGTALSSLLGSTATLSLSSVNYGVRSGTSMASPHVAGVAALLWSQAPDKTNTEIRELLQEGALDLGATGRDPTFGFGLVQAVGSFRRLIGDTDGDGISDAYEAQHSLDASVPGDALGDQDNDGFSNLAEFYAATSASSPTSIPSGAPSASLAAAVLPASRSARVGEAITAFATLINSSSSVAENCAIAPLAPLASSFEFFRTDPQTNRIAGLANQPVDIAAGSAASFIVRLTPTAAFSARDLRLRFGCENSGAAAVLDGLTTLLLSASVSPVPDVVALAATVSGDGVMRASATGAGAFSVATINLGAASDLRVTAESTNPDVPVTISVCPTDALGNCLQPAAAGSEGISVAVAADATPTFSFFLQLGQLTAFDPATTRVRVNFSDSSGEVRGATSVAITRSQ